MSLAAELGHLARPGHGAHDDVRLALVDTLLAANAAGTLTQVTWESAFGDAMRSLRLRVIADAETVVRSAAAHSRFPRRRLRAVLPDAEIADTLLHRLLAEGMSLERLEGAGDDPQARRARAAAVDQGWEGALTVAGGETRRWHGIAGRVAEWRRPTLPLWIVTGVLVIATLLVASWLSGVLASPQWFGPVNAAWWRLWP